MTKACKRSMELAKDFDWWVDERLSKPPLDMKSRSVGLSQCVAGGVRTCRTRQGGIVYTR